MSLLDVYLTKWGLKAPDLENLVRQLHQKRLEVAGFKDDAAEIERQIQASPLGKKLQKAQESQSAAKIELEALDAKLRDVAVGLYQKTGEKQPLGSRIVQIKLYTTLDYDADTALDYAREHLPSAVKLDKRAFEKAAKVISLEFVTVGIEPRATVATDLSQFLED